MLSRVYKQSSLENKTTEVKIVEIPSFSEIQKPLNLEHHEQEELEQAESLASRVIADAEEMAEKIIQQAREEILFLQSEAQQKISDEKRENELACEQATQQAYDEGYQAGLTQGKEEGQRLALDQYEATIRSAKEVLEQAYQEKEQILIEAEAFLIELSTEISRKIIGKALDMQPELTMDIVKETLGKIKERESVSIYVHPRDFSLVEGQRQQFLTLIHEQAEVKIYPDHSIGEGGCVIRTSQGSFDARIDTQLTEIRQHLMTLLEDDCNE